MPLISFQSLSCSSYFFPRVFTFPNRNVRTFLGINELFLLSSSSSLFNFQGSTAVRSCRQLMQYITLFLVCQPLFQNFLEKFFDKLECSILRSLSFGELVYHITLPRVCQPFLFDIFHRSRCRRSKTVVRPCSFDLLSSKGLRSLPPFSPFVNPFFNFIFRQFTHQVLLLVFSLLFSRFGTPLPASFRGVLPRRPVSSRTNRAAKAPLFPFRRASQAPP